MKINVLKNKIIMENYHFDEEIINNVKTWKTYIDNGHFGNPVDIVNTYNRVFEGIKVKQPQTRCGSCLRRCVRMMYDALLQYEKEQEEQHKLQVLEAIDEIMTTDDDEPKNEEKPKSKVGRPKKEKALES